MAAIRMTSLRRAPNGVWLARKMVPEDVRAGYKATFGVSQEARFRVPASTQADAAKQAFRDWDTEVTSRIERLRAEARGAGLPTLTNVWFVAQNEEEPGTPEQWDLMADEYETSFSKFVSADSDLNGDREDATERSPVVRRSVHRALVSLGRVNEFLRERNVALADETKTVFLDALEGDFLPALATLRATRRRQLRTRQKARGIPRCWSEHRTASGSRGHQVHRPHCFGRRLSYGPPSANPPLRQ
jgi:hypothetical protein